MSINLHTKRLKLRIVQQKDLDAIAAIWGDSEGGRYMPDPYYKSGEELVEILEDTPECPVYYFVATLAGFDEVMATCSLGKESPDSDNWSIGYTVRKDYWGNGYAVEMVNALIDFARNQGIDEITAPVAQENKASNRVMQKCGFSVEKESSFKKSGSDIVYPTYIYKYLLSFVLLLILGAFAFATTIYATENVSVVVNGEVVEFGNQAPSVLDGQVLVPIRDIFEVLGFDVGWVSSARQVTLDREDFSVIITIDSSEFSINGETRTLNTPAQTINGSLMLPIRAVLGSVGYFWEWDEATHTAFIKPLPAYITIDGELFSTSETSLVLTRRNLNDGDLLQLRYMVNLEHINLWDNNITDLTPFAGLTGLRVLLLNRNNISDISPLANLYNLERLSLNNNQISELAPLAGLANLTSLSLFENQISDISPLANLVNLTSLDLQRNQISELAPLSNLTNLDLLQLVSNQISDLTHLYGLNNLRLLTLTFNQISDLSTLPLLASLTSLNVEGNQISDLTPIGRFAGLRSLGISQNQISDIAVLAQMVNLTSLSIAQSQISDIAVLAELQGLTSLTIANNQISDISPLANLTNLEFLNASGNQISDLSPLTNLVNLEALWISSNQISDASPVAGLINLNQLNLSSNRISNLAPLAGLASLEVLHLWGNQISDVTPLANLENVMQLVLGFNPIDDWSPIAHIEGVIGRPE